MKMKWNFIAVPLFVFSMNAFAESDHSNSAFIRIYAIGSRKVPQSQYREDTVSFALGYTSDQANNDRSNVVTLGPGEAYKGLLYIGQVQVGEHKGQSKLINKLGEMYFFVPSTSDFEIHNIDKLASSVPEPLAGEYDSESNLDPILNDVIREFHLLREKSGHLTLSAPRLQNNCKLANIADIAKTLNIPPQIFEKVKHRLEFEDVYQMELIRNPALAQSKNSLHLAEEIGPNYALNESIRDYLKEKFPFFQQASPPSEQTPYTRAHEILSKRISNINIYCTTEEGFSGICEDQNCVTLGHHRESTELHIEDKIRSTYDCKVERTEGYTCKSHIDRISMNEQRSGQCFQGICYACHPEILTAANECKLGHFNPHFLDVTESPEPYKVDCSNPPNKPDRTPCNGGLCFDGNCKAFSELTSSQQHNGEKCPQTKDYPNTRYYFDGSCRECDESTPSKLVGTENCSPHPGLSKWLPSRKSCAEPDICVYSEAPAAAPTSEATDSPH